MATPPRSPSPTPSNPTRQQTELALLQSMYPDDLTILTPPATTTAQPSPCDAELQVRLDATHTLALVLPATYPTHSAPHALLEFSAMVPNTHRAPLRARLRELVAQLPPGVECIDVLVGECRDALATYCAAQEAAALAPADAAPAVASARGLRVVLWMHHLLATSKRKAIVQVARELGLAGVSKPGHPGAVYVEGEAGAVRAFVEEIRGMRWQALQERVAQEVEMEALGLLRGRGPGVDEVESLGEVAEALRSGDGDATAELFLAGMKIK